MKKLLLFLFVFASSVINTNAQKTYVLLTGVSSYSNSQANLGNTTKDVKELKTVFNRQYRRKTGSYHKTSQKR